MLGLYLLVSDSVDRIALSRDQVAAVRALLENDTPVITVIFGSPYLLNELPALPSLLLTLMWDHLQLLG